MSTDLLLQNWGGLEDDVASSQELISREVARAEACRSSSDSEDSGNEGTLQPGCKPFWVKLLKTVSQNKGYPTPELPKSKFVRVMSGCTGMGAEGFVFKAW